MTSKHLTKHELRWSQPLRGDEIAALTDNLAHDSVAVAKQSLRAVVRLPLTHQAWSRVAAGVVRLLDRAASFDEPTLAEVLRNAARVPETTTRAKLLAMLEGSLGDEARRHLLSALAGSGELRVIPHLLHQVRSAEPAVRLAAARDLSNFVDLNQNELRRLLAEESHPAVRFWLAFALAIGGASDPLLDFFRERRLLWYLHPPFGSLEVLELKSRVASVSALLRAGWLGKLLKPAGELLRQRGAVPNWDWGTCVGEDDALHFVLHERANLLDEQVRRAIARVPLRPTDARRELQQTLEIREPQRSSGDKNREPLPAPSEADITIAETTVQRWIDSGPDWQREAQDWWEHHRLRNHVELQAFARLDPRLRGRAVTALFVHQFRRMRGPSTDDPWPVMDGGVIMAILLYCVLDGALGIHVSELFRLYWENVKDPVYLGVQLAAAASNATPREVLMATEWALRSEVPEQRRAAAEFIELARRYVGKGIPTWGGEGGEPDTEADRLGGDQLETLSYDPSVEMPAVVVPRQRVTIRVDLRQIEGLDGQLRLDGVAPGWAALIVDVSIVAAGIRISPGRESGVITLYADGTSLPFETEGDVAPEDGQLEIRVCALFSFRGRNCGWTERRVGVDAARSTDVPVTTRIEITPDARAPTLTLRLIRDQSRDVYAFDILTTEELRYLAGMPSATSGIVRVGREDLEQVRHVLGSVGVEDAVRARGMLQGLGDLLYEWLPAAFRDAYRVLRERLGDTFSIQFITDDPGLPWELARPSLPGSSTSLLCETHPCARWHPYQGDPQGARRLRREGAVLTVAATKKGEQRLPRAQEEAAWMVKNLNATKLKPATRERFLSALGKDAPAVAILHVAGHGSFCQHAPVLSKLVLGDGEEWLAAVEIRGASKQALRHALVVLNLCEAGAAEGHIGGSVTSLPESFLHRGAAAVIAPLWTIGDSEAFEMMKRCLPRMLGGTSVAEVLRDARYADDASIDPLAYMLWGDVVAAFGDLETDDFPTSSGTR